MPEDTHDKPRSNQRTPRQANKSCPRQRRGLPSAPPRSGRARFARSGARFELAGEESFPGTHPDASRFRLRRRSRSDFVQRCKRARRRVVLYDVESSGADIGAFGPRRKSLPPDQRVYPPRSPGRLPHASWSRPGAPGSPPCTCSICREKCCSAHSATSTISRTLWHGRKQGNYFAAASTGGKKASLRLWEP